jgi:hypothetical protein
MAKTKISEYSATSADNTDISNINIAEGCSPANVNNAIRTLMAQLKNLQAGTSGDTIPITAGGTGSTTATDARTALSAAKSGANSDITSITGLTTPLTTAQGGTGTASTTFANLTTNVTGTLPVANGGTNQTSYTDGQLLIGNTTGNTLTKATLTAGSGITVTNGSGAITIAASGGGQIQTELFTAPGTWTKPASATQVKVTVVGGGGGGSGGPFASIVGGFGGVAIAQVPVSAPVSITVGAGGAVDASGGTSSFGPAVSSTGGAPGSPAGTPGSPGSGTVSVGTALKTGGGFVTTVSPTQSMNTSVGVILGLNRNAAGGSPVAYSVSSSFAAGAGGAAVPSAGGGVGGAVVVEYIG